MTRTDSVRAKIAAKRDMPLLRLIARISEKYLRAFNNQSNWDVRVNGEAHALQTITAAIAGDVLDVEANEGQWASMALDVIGNRRIHCFEVMPVAFQRLEQKIGNRENAVVNDFGLGATERRIDVYFYPSSTDRTSAFYLNDGFEKVPTSVSIVRGDDYVADRGISQVSFPKIDVEGMEMDVLNGFEVSLRRGIIKGIQFEHGASHVASRHFLGDFVKFLDQFGYTVFRCYPNDLQQMNYEPWRDETFVGQNFIAILPDVRRACGL